MRETASLKTLTYKDLERLQRNVERNKNETNGEKIVSQNPSRETKTCPHESGELVLLQKSFLIQLSSLPEEYEERIAIAEYDGHHSSPKPNALPTRMRLSPP